MMRETVIRIFSRRDPRAGDGAAGDQQQTDQQAAGDQTLLGDGAAEYQIPEKFMVMGEDGQPDYKSITGKLGQSYAHLEKRFGSGDVPPTTADEYQLEKYLPDGMEPVDANIKPILGEFHKLGLTQKQVQGVMNVFGQQVELGLSQEKAGFESGQATLKAAWGGEYDARLASAKKAIAAYGAEDPEIAKIAADPKLSNNPLIVRLLSLAGADLNEDRPAKAMEGAAAESIDEIRKSPAYLNPKDPGHADAVRKVNEAYTKGYRATR